METELAVIGDVNRSGRSRNDISSGLVIQDVANLLVRILNRPRPYPANSTFESNKKLTIVQRQIAV
jgi:hypothetical protein